MKNRTIWREKEKRVEDGDTIHDNRWKWVTRWWVCPCVCIHVSGRGMRRVFVCEKEHLRYYRAKDCEHQPLWSWLCCLCCSSILWGLGEPYTLHHPYKGASDTTTSELQWRLGGRRGRKVFSLVKTVLDVCGAFHSVLCVFQDSGVGNFNKLGSNVFSSITAAYIWNWVRQDKQLVVELQSRNHFHFWFQCNLVMHQCDFFNPGNESDTWTLGIGQFWLPICF